MCIYINPKYVLNGLFELARFDVSFSDQLFHGKKKEDMGYCTWKAGEAEDEVDDDFCTNKELWPGG